MPGHPQRPTPKLCDFRRRKALERHFWYATMQAPTWRGVGTLNQDTLRPRVVKFSRTLSHIPHLQTFVLNLLPWALSLRSHRQATRPDHLHPRPQLTRRVPWVCAQCPPANAHELEGNPAIQLLLPGPGPFSPIDKFEPLSHRPKDSEVF